jgi:hypothetical protein
MGEIVFAAGVPHAPALVGLLDRATPEAQRVVRESFAAVGSALEQSGADVLVVVANDHITNSRIREYPDFLLGMAAEHRGPDAWFKPWIGCRDWAMPGDPAVAEALFRGMGRRGVRLFARRDPLRFDDNLSVPVVLGGLDRTGMAVVPLLQNCTVPPYPDQRRCYAVGEALAAVIRDELPAGRRVALLASGGLSHEPGGARYYAVDAAFDRRFLALCAAGDHARLLDEITVERMEAAGAGGTTELLAWFVVLGAIGPHPGRSFGYTDLRDFRCGMGAVQWDLGRAA